MSLTRRTLLRGLPLLLAVPRVTQAQETWVPSAHPLNDPRTCLGWWLTTPLTGTVTWRDLLHRRVGTLTNMDLGSSATSGLQRRTTRVGGWGHVACDGTNDVVSTSDLADSLLTMSLSAWIKTSVADRQGILVKAADDDTAPGWSFGTSAATPGALVLYYTTDAAHYRGELGSVNVADGRWHHIGATVSGTSLTSLTMVLYLDGQVTASSASNAAEITAISTASPVTFGAFAGGAPRLTGALDDVRLYARTLQAPALRLLYQEARLGYPTLLAPGPQVAYAPPPPLPSIKLPSFFFNP